LRTLYSPGGLPVIQTTTWKNWRVNWLQ